MPAILRMPSASLPTDRPVTVRPVTVRPVTFRPVTFRGAGRLLVAVVATAVALASLLAPGLASPSAAETTAGAKAQGSVGAGTRPPTRAERIARARNIALHQAGDPYRYGAAGPNAFDCSGLVYYSYRRAGLTVPRTSSAQSGHARRIGKGAIRSGDLMFFSSGYGVYHVGIFLRWRGGRAVMLHSPQPGQRVKVEPSWTSSWFAGTLRSR